MEGYTQSELHDTFKTIRDIILVDADNVQSKPLEFERVRKENFMKKGSITDKKHERGELKNEKKIEKIVKGMERADRKKSKGGCK